MRRNHKFELTRWTRQIVRLALPVGVALLFVLNSCKKDETGIQESTIDPAFTGVWYAASDSVGFEVQSDGTCKTLMVDTAGKLQYATSGSTIYSAITLTLISAANGNLFAEIRYRVQGFIDTTVNVPGVYAFSNNNNTVTITFPNPQSGQPLAMVFQRSSIGAIVKPRSVSGLIPRQ